MLRDMCTLSNMIKVMIDSIVQYVACWAILS